MFNHLRFYFRTESTVTQIPAPNFSRVMPAARTSTRRRATSTTSRRAGAPESPSPKSYTRSKF